jgi:hypothetical protein
MTSAFADDPPRWSLRANLLHVAYMSTPGLDLMTEPERSYAILRRMREFVDKANADYKHFEAKVAAVEPLIATNRVALD